MDVETVFVPDGIVRDKLPVKSVLVNVPLSRFITKVVSVATTVCEVIVILKLCPSLY